MYDFLQELRRRNVVRVAVAYIVITWLLAQVAELALDSFEAPAWVMKAILLVFALGLPLALFLAWAFELTPEGLKKEKDVNRSQSITRQTGRKLDYFIIGVLLVAVGYFAYDKFALPPETTGSTIASEQPDSPATSAEGKSIAVLPFANMSGDESSGYFSDGLADTVLHMLAQVENLRVAARTSSFQFRDRAMDISEIGRQLNVSSVLEGSVQRAGDKIRVTAQLIDVSSGYHLWSGNFDRDLNDVFAIQDEIANEVVAALKLSLLGESTASLTRDSTDNLAAYTSYLLAVDDLSSINSDNLSSAANHLQEAIRLDPEYARAYSTLGRAYLQMAYWGAIGQDQAIAAARNVATRALEFDADSYEALAVLGRAADLDGDRELAGEFLEKAIEIAPNDVVALNFYALYLRRMARPDEAAAIYREMIHLDPLSEDAHLGFASVLVNLAQYDEARDVLANFMVIQPDSQRAGDQVYEIDVLENNFATAITTMTERVELLPDDPDPEGQYLIGLNYLALDMPTEAGRWFDRAIETDARHPVSRAAPLLLDYYSQEIDEESFRLARELLADRIDDRLGSRLMALLVLTEYGAETDRHQLVLDTLDNMYPHLFDDPPHDLDKDLNGTFFVGKALSESGDTDRGRHLLKSYAELKAPARLAYGADLGDVAYPLLVGDIDSSLSSLAEVAKHSSRGNFGKLILERASLFDLLREEPAFIALLDEYNENAEEQRQLLQAMSPESSGQ